MLGIFGEVGGRVRTRRRTRRHDDLPDNARTVLSLLYTRVHITEKRVTTVISKCSRSLSYMLPVAAVEPTCMLMN